MLSGFVVAMSAEVDLAKYDQPTSIVRRLRRWLIVSRLGAGGELLTISDAGPMADGSPEAPIGLSPIKTLLGILLSQTDGANSTFILARQRPENLQLAGTFFPAEGYVRIAGPLDGMQFHAEGRHAHSLGRRDGRDVRNYVSDPAPNSRFAMAWHVRAARRRWTGEFVPA